MQWVALHLFVLLSLREVSRYSRSLTIGNANTGPKRQIRTIYRQQFNYTLELSCDFVYNHSSTTSFLSFLAQSVQIRSCQTLKQRSQETFRLNNPATNAEVKCMLIE